MAFVYSIKLPGFNKEVWVKEITCRSYKDLIKSLYNKDDSSFIIHSNNLVEQIAPGLLQGGLNIIDKIILLVNARAVSINPDLKLKAICSTTKNEFEYNIALDDIFHKLSDIHYSHQTTIKGITVTHSIAKAKDEMYFLEQDIERLFIYQLASCIDKIETNDQSLHFNTLDFKSRCEIVENLPMETTTGVFKFLTVFEESLSKHKLLFVKSPFTEDVVVDVALSVDINMLRSFCKLLFTDDLNNIYRLCLNLVTDLGFTGEYVENMPPAEMYLYWAIHLQKEKQREDATKSVNNDNTPRFQGVPADVI